MRRGGAAPKRGSPKDGTAQIFKYLLAYYNSTPKRLISENVGS